MAYPEDMLAPQESLILHRHPHWKTLFWPTIEFLLATLAAGLLSGFVISREVEGNAAMALHIAIAAAWFAITVAFFIIPLLRWKTTHFIVTDRRVLIRHGILTHTGIDIPLNRVSNVQFRHTWFDRLLRTGTLILGSASEDPLELDDVPQVEKVHSMLYHQVFDAGQVSERSPSEDRRGSSQ